MRMWLAIFLLASLASARTPAERARDAEEILESGLAKLAVLDHPRSVANELASAAMELDAQWGLDFLRRLSKALRKTMPEANVQLGVYEHLAALATPHDRGLRDRYLGRAHAELTLQEEKAIAAYPLARSNGARDELRWLKHRARLRRQTIDILLTPQPHYDRLVHLQKLAQDAQAITRQELPIGSLHNSGEVEVMQVLARYDIDLMLALGSSRADPGFHRFVAAQLNAEPHPRMRRPMVEFLRRSETRDWVYHFLRERLAIADYEGAIKVARLLPAGDAPFGYGRDASMYTIASHLAVRDPGLARRLAEGNTDQPYGYILRRAAAEGWARTYPEAFSQAFPDYARFPRATQFAADEFMRRHNLEDALAIAKPDWPRLAVQSRWMADEERIVFLQRCLAHSRDSHARSVIIAELLDIAPNTGLRALQEAYIETAAADRLALASQLGRHPDALQAFYTALAEKTEVRAPEHLDSLGSSDGKFAYMLASNLPDSQVALSRVAAGLARRNLSAAEALLERLPPDLRSPQPLWINHLTVFPNKTRLVTDDRATVFVTAALENWSEAGDLSGIHSLLASLPRDERNEVGGQIVLALLDRGALEEAESLLDRVDRAPFVRAASRVAPVLAAR